MNSNIEKKLSCADRGDLHGELFVCKRFFIRRYELYASVIRKNQWSETGLAGQSG